MRITKQSLSILDLFVFFIIPGLFAFFPLFSIYAMVADLRRCEERKIYNKNFVVIKVGKDDGVTSGKIHTPTVYKTVLAMSTEDTTKFIEWSMTTEKFYNTHIGDTLKFKFLNKERLFTIR